MGTCMKEDWGEGAACMEARASVDDSTGELGAIKREGGG